MCFSSSADSRIGKVDQDGQIGIWKKEHNVKDFFFQEIMYYQNISITNILKSGLLRYTIDGIITDKMNRPKN